MTDEFVVIVKGNMEDSVFYYSNLENALKDKKEYEQKFPSFIYKLYEKETKHKKLLGLT